MFNWRTLRTTDINAVCAIAAQVHPGFPEDEAVLAERIALAPENCFMLDIDGAHAGYCLAHPFKLGAIPALNSTIGRLPERPDTFYIHDLALLPGARGTGAAREIVETLIALSRPFITMSLVAVNGSAPFWTRMGFAPHTAPGLARKLLSYGPGTVYMVRPAAPLP